MPNNIIKSFAEKIKKSEIEVEKLWDKSILIVDKQYPDIEKDSDKYFQVVVGVLKNMLGIKEDVSITTSDIATFQKRLDIKKKVKNNNLSEQIEYYLNESTFSKNTFHISRLELDKSKIKNFQDIINQSHMNKPLGGFWLAPNENWTDFYNNLYKGTFDGFVHKVALKGINKIYNLNSESQYKKLWKDFKRTNFIYGQGESELDKKDSKYNWIDWDKMSKKYDGVFVDPKKLNKSMSEWDTPTILLFKNIIKEIKYIKQI